MTEQAVGCRHAAWKDTSHCAEMSCRNYINKCMDEFHEHETAVDAQAYPDKIYFQFTDLDKPGEHNAAISYVGASELWQKLRGAWMTQTRKEFVHCRIEEVIPDRDSFEGWMIVNKFVDLETVTLHLDNYGKLTCPAGTMLEVARIIR